MIWGERASVYALENDSFSVSLLAPALLSGFQIEAFENESQDVSKL
jgi:hypothetical protein